MTVAVGLTLVTSPVAAQEADELIEAEVTPDTRVLAEGGFVYQSDTDIDGGGGASMQALRYDVGLIGVTNLLDNLRWRNTFFFGVHDYDFDGDGFSAGNPWSTILNMRLGTTLTYMFNEQWGASVGGIFVFSPESGADWGDSFTGGGLIAAEYRHSKTLFASIGVAVISQIEDDAQVTPAVNVTWLPADDWKLRVGAVPASGGTAAAGELAYRFAAPLEIGLGLLFHQRRFRLDGSGPAPDGVGEDTNLPVRLRLGWDVASQITANLLAGVVTSGEVRLEDRNGTRLRKEDYDPAAYVGLRLVGVF